MDRKAAAATEVTVVETEEEGKGGTVRRRVHFLASHSLGTPQEECAHDSLCCAQIFARAAPKTR